MMKLFQQIVSVFVVQFITNEHDFQKLTSFDKIGALKNFAKFTGEHLRPVTLLKIRPQRRCFLLNFAKFLRTPFLNDCFWIFSFVLLFFAS